MRTLDAFHQKCLRQLLGIRWYDRVRNDEVLQRNGLTLLFHLLSRRRISVFGHVARLDDNTPANVALQLHINVSLNRPPDRMWRRPPVVHGTSGSTSYETISPVRLETSGSVLSTVDMVVQRREGPRRLRDDDDDELSQNLPDYQNHQIFRPSRDVAMTTDFVGFIHIIDFR